MPRVSIVIPAYNCGAFVSETLDRALNQTCQDFEIIVVDDGSADNTSEVLQGYGNKIKYVYQENSGMAAARNRGVGLSQSEYIAFLDHDDLFYPTKLEKQAALLEHNPRLGMAYCDADIIDSEGHETGRYFSIPGKGVTPARGHVFVNVLQRTLCNPTMAMIPRRVFEELGGFAPYRYAADYDLWLKIAYRYPIDYVPEALCAYRVHPRMAGKTLLKEYTYTDPIEVMTYWLERLDASEDALREVVRRRRSRFEYKYAYALIRRDDIAPARQWIASALEDDPGNRRAIVLSLVLKARLAKPALALWRTIRGVE